MPFPPILTHHWKLLIGLMQYIFVDLEQNCICKYYWISHEIKNFCRRERFRKFAFLSNTFKTPNLIIFTPQQIKLSLKNVGSCTISVFNQVVRSHAVNICWLRTKWHFVSTIEFHTKWKIFAEEIDLENLPSFPILLNLLTWSSSHHNKLLLKNVGSCTISVFDQVALHQTQPPHLKLF